VSTKISNSKDYDQPLDEGNSTAVKVLRNVGVDTFESCEGVVAHTMRPSVRKRAIDTENKNIAKSGVSQQEEGNILFEPSVSPRQRSFVCSRCGSKTDAPPTTQRSKDRLCRKCFGKGVDRRPKDLNELTGAQWARYSKSVQEYPDTRSPKQRIHGACFPKSLALQQIEIFTKSGDTVLDPFLGVGTTLDAAVELRRNGIGFELNPEFAAIASKDLQRARELGLSHTIFVDDSRNLARLVKAESVDFILTSPPYSTLLKSVKGNFAYKWREHSTLNPISNPRPYSIKKEDLGNMPYDSFLDAIKEIMQACFIVLRPNCYAVWVVKDYRDLKSKIPYVNFHGDVIGAATEGGFTLWDIRVYDQTKFRPLVCLGFPSRNFYLNIGHSFLLTFKKEK
jgi:DNA modification methylase